MNYFVLATYVVTVDGEWVIYAVLAVFAERRQDRHGPCVVLHSVTLN